LALLWQVPLLGSKVLRSLSLASPKGLVSTMQFWLCIQFAVRDMGLGSWMIGWAERLDDMIKSWMWC